MSPNQVVPVYIPVEGTHTNIAPGSGIVGGISDQKFENGTFEIYYEGNIYGAVNLKRFAQRVEVAYLRMRDNAPTIAKEITSPDTLKQIGFFHVRERVIGLSHTGVTQELLNWLGIKGNSIQADELSARDVYVSQRKPVAPATLDVPYQMWATKRQGPVRVIDMDDEHLCAAIRWAQRRKAQKLANLHGSTDPDFDNYEGEFLSEPGNYDALVFQARVRGIDVNKL